MDVKPTIQKAILQAISAIGTNGASIIEMERHVTCERHTLSKYLSFLQAQGIVYHKIFGKAKVWFINKAPLQTVLNTKPEQMTFTEKILSNICATIPYGLFVIDTDFNVLFLNEKMKGVYGPIVGEKLYQAILGEKDQTSFQAISSLIASEQSACEMEIEDKLGKTLRFKGTKLINPDETFGILLIVDDVTARKKAEEQVREHKELLQAEREALNQAAIVAETDLAGRITYANDKFMKISGYSLQELLGQNHRIINSGYHRKPFFRDLWKTIAKGKVWQGQIRNKKKNGNFYWVDTVIAPVFGKDGKPVKYLSIRFEITRLKDAEEALAGRKITAGVKKC